MMDDTREYHRIVNAVGWGLLLILWGTTILFDFVPFGVGVLGTGLILLGANWVHVRNDLPARDDNTLLGILALSWGVLEWARPALQQLFNLADWDWAIFAILLVELGMILIVRGLLRARRAILQNLG
jgi:hypothetical protein